MFGFSPLRFRWPSGSSKSAREWPRERALKRPTECRVPESAERPLGLPSDDKPLRTGGPQEAPERLP
eukprot:8119814-Pyramimonas_sp.AAC.1